MTGSFLLRRYQCTGLFDFESCLPGTGMIPKRFPSHSPLYSLCFPKSSIFLDLQGSFVHFVPLLSPIATGKGTTTWHFVIPFLLTNWFMAKSLRRWTIQYITRTPPNYLAKTWRLWSRDPKFLVPLCRYSVYKGTLGLPYVPIF